MPLKHANFLWDFNQVFNDSILFFLRILIILVIIWGFMGNSAGKQSTCNAGDPGLIPGSGRSPREGIGYPRGYSWASSNSTGKESVCNVGDLGSISGVGRSPGEGKGYPLQYSGLENSMDSVHGIAKSQTQLSGFHFTSGKVILDF